MNADARKIQRIYLTLTLGNTLAASFIWGINTLFLLDAGLSNLEAFAANAFFTAGMVLFEVPTGVVADGWGRRVSFLLGTVTLAGSTYLYYVLWQLSAPFWAWAVVSVLLGLGFTFFSGAVEAWLVDALRFSGYEGGLEAVLGRGVMVSGVAMLVGSVAGGVIAQVTDLGVPFLLRVGVLLAMFVVAFWLMHDVGFTPERSTHPLQATRAVLAASIENGLKNPPVRYVMLAAPFSAGVGIYVFYALQPYLLELFGDPRAYSVAGLAAAIVAGAEVLGGWVAPRIRRLVRKRTTVLILSGGVSAMILVVLGFTQVFWAALALLALWALVDAAGVPVRQAYLNDMIASKQRATVLSFDSLIGSGGGVVVQPLLGRAADVYGYPASLAIGGVIQLIAVPFLLASRRQGPRPTWPAPPPARRTRNPRRLSGGPNSASLIAEATSCRAGRTCCRPSGSQPSAFPSFSSSGLSFADSSAHATIASTEGFSSSEATLMIGRSRLARMFIPVLPALALGLDTTILIRSQVCSVVSFAGAEHADAERMRPAASRAVVSFFMVPLLDAGGSIVSRSLRAGRLSTSSMTEPASQELTVGGVRRGNSSPGGVVPAVCPFPGSPFSTAPTPWTGFTAAETLNLRPGTRPKG